MMLQKSHANDAAAITTKGEPHKICEETVYYKQVRKKKRSLHEATPRKGRKTPNREAKRNPKKTKAAGKFHLYDTVSYNGQTGFITGFSGRSEAYLQDFEGNYITTPGKTYKQINLSALRLVRRNNNWISQTKAG